MLPDILLFLLAIYGMVVWSWTKNILMRHNYPVGSFWNHMQDIPNILDLASKTKNKSDKRKYNILGWSIISLLILIPLIFFTMVVGRK